MPLPGGGLLYCQDTGFTPSETKGVFCETSFSLALTDVPMVLNGPIVKVGSSKIRPSRELVISLQEIQLEQSLNHGAMQIVKVMYWLRRLISEKLKISLSQREEKEIMVSFVK